MLSAETDSSEGFANELIAVRERQLHRFRAEKIFSYSAMTRRMIGNYCLDEASEQLLGAGKEVSARAHDCILKVSQIIADFEGCEAMVQLTYREAVGYRSLECNTGSDLAGNASTNSINTSQFRS